MHLLLKTLATLSLFFFLSCVTAPAAEITFSNQTVDLHGTGFGNVYSLLSVHATGQQTAEFGSVLWNGSTDVLSGNAQPGAQTNTQFAATVQSLTNANNHFGLIFNINQPGSNPSITLRDFTLVFQNAGGATLFTATFRAAPGGNDLAQVDNGTGAAGYLFDVALTASEAALFFANPNNRLGEFITEANGITNAQGGPENFFLQGLGPDAGGSGPGDPGPGHHMPEPTSLLVWAAFGLGALGLGARSLRRGTPPERQ
jgi:hypothetical protein